MGYLPHSWIIASVSETPDQIAACLANPSLFFLGFQRQTMVNWTLLSMMPMLMA